MKLTNVYGPVPSRRLGASLGVSLIPHKTCTYSCVYCQLGRTTHLTICREEFYDCRNVLEQIFWALDNSRAFVGFVTFAGDGEPTLHSRLGKIVDAVAENTNKKVAIMTNGALFFSGGLRKEIKNADVVIVTLDASNEQEYRVIHRPHPALRFSKYIDGLMAFSSEFGGELWIETMLVSGINDNQETINRIKALLEKLNPTRFFLTTPIRPPAEKWVRAPPKTKVAAIAELLEKAEVLNFAEGANIHSVGQESAADALMAVGRRHPLRLDQAKNIEEMFGRSVVGELLTKGKARVVKHDGVHYLIFY